MDYIAAKEPIQLRTFPPDRISDKARKAYQAYVDQLERDLRELVDELTSDNWTVKEAYAEDLKQLTVKYRAIAELETSPEIEREGELLAVGSQPSFSD